ncbi:MAG: DUF6876 family protein [Saprospiraceae bacterium]
MINTQKLIHDLAQFSGTENWYRNPLFPKYLYTDGVKYLAEQASCYWLIDYIFSNQIDAKIRSEEFQTWKIITKDNQATIIVEDGNHNIVKQFKLEFTDFRLKEFTLWFTNSTLLLPSEY